MKRFAYTLVVVLVMMMLVPVASVYAQTPSKKQLPQVPITYPGDTDKTIARRAEWIEGAKKEGNFSLWGTLTPDAGVKVVAEFTKIYPFIKADYWRGKGEEIAAKLEAGYIAGRAPVDACHGGEPINYPRWRKMGMMAPFTDILPGIATLDKRLYGRNSDWAMPGHTVVTPQYNTKLVTAAEAPKSWEDLLDPKWKGQIAMTSDMKVWVTMALGEGGWGAEKTQDFLGKISKQNLIWAAGHTEAHNLMLPGEFKILSEGYVYHVLRSQTKGAPAEWVKVKPAIVNGPSLHIPTKAIHPNAARLFVEWLFSPQGLKYWEEASGGMGAAFPGMGTKQSKVLEGVPLVVENEDVILQGIQMKLAEKFAQVLGIPQ